MVNISFQDNQNKTIELLMINLQNRGSIITLTQTQGLFDLDHELVSGRVPRTDFFETNSILQTQKVRTFSGFIKGMNARDKIELRQNMAGLIGKEIEFRVDLFLPDNKFEIFESYKFTGIIKNFIVPDIGDKASQYSITVVCDDPFLYSFENILITRTLALTGRTYPVVYPIVYGGDVNTITYTNTGNSDILPIWRVKNTTNDLRIRNNVTGQIFRFGLNTIAGQTLEIDTRLRTAKLNMSNVLANTQNISALTIPIGANSWTVFSNSIDNTQIEIAFNKTYKSI